MTLFRYWIKSRVGFCTGVKSQHRPLSHYFLLLWKQSLQKGWAWVCVANWGCDLYLSHLPEYCSQVLFFFVLNQHFMSLSGRSQHAIIYARLIPCHIKRVIKFVSLRLMSCWLTLLRQLTRDITSYPQTETSLPSNFSRGQDTCPEFSLCLGLAGEWQREATSDPCSGALVWWFMCSLTSADDILGQIG